MNYTYITLKKEHLPFLETLFKHKEYESIFFENNTTLSDWEKRFEYIKTFQIIYQNQTPIGVLNLVKEGNIISIALLALLYQERRKHHGKRIINDIVNSHPTKRIQVEAMKRNKQARFFYENNGFVPISERIEKYDNKAPITYTVYEQIKLIPYQETDYHHFISLSVKQTQKHYVSTPDNILYKHIKDKHNTDLYMIHFQDKIIGALLVRHNHSTKNTFIWQLLISKEHQNNKIGQTTLKYYISKHKETYKNYTLTTTIHTSNTKSKHIFTKHNFILHSKEEDIKEVNYILKP